MSSPFGNAMDTAQSLAFSHNFVFHSCCDSTSAVRSSVSGTNPTLSDPSPSQTWSANVPWKFRSRFLNAVTCAGMVTSQISSFWKLILQGSRGFSPRARLPACACASVRPPTIFDADAVAEMSGCEELFNKLVRLVRRCRGSKGPPLLFEAHVRCATHGPHLRQLRAVSHSCTSHHTC